jgi:hypothetical protein
MDMKTVMRVRLMRKPMTPSEKRIAERRRYQELGTSFQMDVGGGGVA